MANGGIELLDEMMSTPDNTRLVADSKELMARAHKETKGSNSPQDLRNWKGEVHPGRIPTDAKVGISAAEFR